MPIPCCSAFRIVRCSRSSTCSAKIAAMREAIASLSLSCPGLTRASLRFPASAILAAMLGTWPAFAVEQCRFIQAKPEREACYQRQEAELAAKRKPEPAPRSKFMESLEQMKHEDEA